MYRKHADKRDVQKILVCADLAEKRRLTSVLVSRANFLYNQKMMLQPEWEAKQLILKYQKKKFADQIQKSEVLGCHYCGAAYHGNSLFRHKCVAGYKEGKKEGERIYIKSKSHRSWSHPLKATVQMRNLLDGLQ